VSGNGAQQNNDKMWLLLIVERQADMFEILRLQCLINLIDHLFQKQLQGREAQ
jgi:hypothetical protein